MMSRVRTVREDSPASSHGRSGVPGRRWVLPDASTSIFHVDVGSICRFLWRRNWSVLPSPHQVLQASRSERWTPGWFPWSAHHEEGQSILLARAQRFPGRWFVLSRGCKVCSQLENWRSGSSVLCMGPIPKTGGHQPENWSGYAVNPSRIFKPTSTGWLSYILIPSSSNHSDSERGVSGPRQWALNKLDVHLVARHLSLTESHPRLNCHSA